MAVKPTTASAPTKLILFGEHFVVYGAPGIAIPISPRNYVEVRRLEGEPCLHLTGVMGDAVFEPGGRICGDLSLGMFGAAYRFLNESGIAKTGRFKADVKLDRRCKGIGNSSSIGAALGLAVAGASGIRLAKEGIFECAQRVDEVAHGGRPSGIDARTVVEGKPQAFRRLFSPPGFEFGDVEVRLPAGHSLVVIDTFRGTKSTTRELVGRFGHAVGAGGLPETLGGEERARICAPYTKIYDGVVGLLSKGTPDCAKSIGGLMNENHLLLSERGVSTDEIEAVRAGCLKAGALGVKISGAGGEGGAVVALVSEKKIKGVEAIAKDLGFDCFVVEIALRGAVLEK